MVELVIGLVVLGAILYLLATTTVLTSLAIFLFICAVVGCAGIWIFKAYRKKRADVGSPEWFQVWYQLQRLLYYLTQVVVYFGSYVAAFFVWPDLRELVCYMHPLCSGPLYFTYPSESEWAVVGSLGWCSTLWGGQAMYEAVTGERDI